MSSPEAALQLVLIGVGWVSVVSSLEFVGMRTSMGPSGLWDWDVLRLRTRASMRVPCAGLVGESAGGVWVALCLTRATAGVAAPVALLASTRLSGLALLVVAATTFAMMYRMMYGLDGSDQLTAVLALTAGSALLVGDMRAIEAFCWFVATLMCIAYVTAGLTKIGSATWRSGQALHIVMRTEVYGRPAWAELARGRLGTLVTRGVVVAELAYPLVFLGSMPLTVSLLAVLTSFHLGTAFIMGLNCFFPAYVCTFGAVLWCSTQVW